MPALLPALTPCVPASGARPAWHQAFVGESMMWVFGIGVAVFAATLNPLILYAFIVLGFIGYLPGRMRGRRSP